MSVIKPENPAHKKTTPQSTSPSTCPTTRTSATGGVQAEKTIPNRGKLMNIPRISIILTRYRPRHTCCLKRDSTGNPGEDQASTIAPTCYSTLQQTRLVAQNTSANSLGNTIFPLPDRHHRPNCRFGIAIPMAPKPPPALRDAPVTYLTCVFREIVSKLANRCRHRPER